MPLRLFASASALLLAAASAVLACAPAPRPGQRVDVADESALIVWDAASHTQHFIRRATFATPADDFGFLVPTPSRPTLAEAPDLAFDHLKSITAPRVITKREYRPAGGIGCGANAPPTLSARPDTSVHVLEQTRVAGYDAAVLAADDPAALNRWLGEHGYESRPTLTEWLAPYTKAGWTVTAFTITKSTADAPNVRTAAVRMTFQTDRPFFPYREPDDQRDSSANRPHRLLRVYFVGDGRYDGTRESGETWPGRTVWANSLPDQDAARLAESLKIQLPAGSRWLTEFEDRSSPRPGTDDVYFKNMGEQFTIEHPPQTQVEYVDLPDLISIAIVVLVLAALVMPVVKCLLRWNRAGV
jgi:hypothetical protein